MGAGQFLGLVGEQRAPAPGGEPLPPGLLVFSRKTAKTPLGFAPLANGLCLPGLQSDGLARRSLGTGPLSSVFCVSGSGTFRVQPFSSLRGGAPGLAWSRAPPPASAASLPPPGRGAPTSGRHPALCAAAYAYVLRTFCVPVFFIMCSLFPPLGHKCPEKRAWGSYFL